MKPFTLEDAIANRELFWTCVDACNNFGYDKLLLKERVRFIVTEQAKLRDLIADAEKPSLFLRAVEAIEDIQADEAPNHFVHLDSTNSALQFYAVLTGDKKLAETCNVSPVYDENGVEIRTDAYGILRDDLNSVLGSSLFDRNACKPVLMQTLYGSQNAWRTLIDPTGELDRTRHNQHDAQGDIIWLDLTDGTVKPAQLPSEFDWAHLSFIQKHIDADAEFNDLVEMSCDGMDDLVMTALWNAFPVAMEVLELILSFHTDEHTHYTWPMPTGFVARSNVKVRELDVVSLDLGFASDVEVAVTRRTLGTKKVSAALAPDIIHSCDAMAVEVVGNYFESIAIPIVVIHDDFGVPATHADELRTQYQNVLISILESDLLNDILTSLPTCPKGFKYIKKQTLTAEDIRACEFILS